MTLPLGGFTHLDGIRFSGTFIVHHMSRYFVNGHLGTTYYHILTFMEEKAKTKQNKLTHPIDDYAKNGRPGEV